jgi:serine/threonine protein kinase
VVKVGAIPRVGPSVIGRYALYDKIASGGMAVVHIGRLLGPIGFSRTVALKRMLPQYAADPGFVSMFVDEARLASRIRHPNVVPTLDVVSSAAELFLVMEYVHGETLSQIIKTCSIAGTRVPLDFTAAIICNVLQGLHAAHHVKDEKGRPLELVHRDVSPQNVLVGTDGVARLLDFGVAKAVGRLQTTTAGQLKGKLAYMAPEQVKGNVSAQSDVYAASAVLWEMLTCKRLFHNTEWTNIAETILERKVLPPSTYAPEVPEELDAIVLRGLEKDPSRRFKSAREMAFAIQECMDIASPLEIGDWVERTGGAVLAERAQKIAAIESHSADAGLAREPADPDDSEATRRVAVEDLRRSITEVVTEPEAARFASHAGRSSIPPKPLAITPFHGYGSGSAALSLGPRPKSQRGVLAAFTIFVGLFLAVAALALVRRRPSPAREGDGLSMQELTQPSPPRTLDLTPIPSVALAPPGLAADRAGVAMAPAPAVSSGPRPIARSPRVQAQPRRGPASSCNPPYTVDKNHIRHIKLECL